MIVITGASGQVGREVVRGLDGTGVHLRLAVHNRASAAPMIGRDIEAVEMNFADAGSIERAFSGADYLFLLTPNAEQSVQWAKQAIDIARQVGISHIVRLSAMGAENDPPVRLLHWHYEVEQYLQNSGVPFTILRPNAFMENFLYQVDAIRREGTIYSSVGEGRISFIATKDIGLTAAEILVTPGFTGKSYDLTGPTAVSYAEVAEAFSRATGRKIRAIDLRDDEMRQSMRGQPEWLIDNMLELFAFFRQGGVSDIVSDAVEAITTSPPQEINAWALDHASAFAQAA